MGSWWTFEGAGRLVFGWGACEALGEQLGFLGLRRVFAVTDSTLKAHSIVQRVHDALAGAGIEVRWFDEGEPEPPVEVARKAAQAARTAQPQAVLGLGGGSNIDVAKIVALLLAHGGSPHDYFGFGRVPGPVLPIVAIPTTAGTGSEVSHAAVLTDTDAGVKVSTLSPFLRPRLAVVDPSLTLSCPPAVTGAAAMDALTHAIEAFTARPYEQLRFPDAGAGPYTGRAPLGSLLAEEAIRLIGQHLPVVMERPSDREARTGLALAATLAGLAFSNCGVALVHALEYPIGVALHCAHGAGNGLLLPHVMDFNRPACAPQLAQVARLLGQDTRGMTDDQAAQCAVHQVRQLGQIAGVPQRLRDLGARPEDLRGFAEKAFQIKRLLAVNPREATLEDLVQILERAW